MEMSSSALDRDSTSSDSSDEDGPNEKDQDSSKQQVHSYIPYEFVQDIVVCHRVWVSIIPTVVMPLGDWFGKLAIVLDILRSLQPVKLPKSLRGIQFIN